MIELLFGVLHEGLKLLNTKESNKYLDEIISLREQWLNEYNKPKKSRSNADLDSIELRLSIIARSFIDSTGKQKT
jgi:hypothetical protein